MRLGDHVQDLVAPVALVRLQFSGGVSEEFYRNLNAIFEHLPLSNAITTVLRSANMLNGITVHVAEIKPTRGVLKSKSSMSPRVTVMFSVIWFRSFLTSLKPNPWPREKWEMYLVTLGRCEGKG